MRKRIVDWLEQPAGVLTRFGAIVFYGVPLLVFAGVLLYHA